MACRWMRERKRKRERRRHKRQQESRAGEEALRDRGLPCKAHAERQRQSARVRGSAVQGRHAVPPCCHCLPSHKPRDTWCVCSSAAQMPGAKLSALPPSKATSPPPPR